MKVVSILELDQYPDFYCNKYGCMAKRRPDVAPFAFEITLNAPLDSATLREIMAYAKGACQDLVRDLYSVCNGLRVGATKFTVYGVNSELPRDDFDAVQFMPIDINRANIYGRPETYPENCLIIGSSSEISDNGAKLECYHSIENRSIIRVSLKEDFNTILRQYGDVEDWLKSETKRAIHDETLY